MTSQKQTLREFNELDNKIEKLKKQRPKNFKETYYICPECGELSTFSQQLESCAEGGMPYCYCEFGGERGRIFIGYKKISRKLWEELKKLKTDKLRLKNYIKFKVKKRKNKK